MSSIKNYVTAQWITGKYKKMLRANLFWSSKRNKFKFYSHFIQKIKKWLNRVDSILLLIIFILIKNILWNLKFKKKAISKTINPFLSTTNFPFDLIKIFFNLQHNWNHFSSFLTLANSFPQKKIPSKLRRKRV